MKIINKKQIRPYYDFPEWDSLLIKGYMFYIERPIKKTDWATVVQYEVLFRFRDWFLCRELI